MTDDQRRASTGSKPSGAKSPGPIPTFDLYAVLAVRPEATQQEIVEAVAAMEGRLATAAARQRGGSTARQKRFNVARYWLLDPGRRRQYDAGRGRAAAAAAAAAGRVRPGRVGAGSATRRPGGTRAWYENPIVWAIGAVALVAVVAVLVLRPGSSTAGAKPTGSPGASAGPSGSAQPSASPGSSGSIAPSASEAPSGSAAASTPPGSPGPSSSEAAVASRPPCPAAQPPAAPAGQTETVTIETAKGTMAITVKNDLSPIAAGNFVALARCGFYDGVVFHRVATLQDGTPFVIQGGDPTGTGSGGPGYTIQDEPVNTPYVRGTVAMARTGDPNSAGSQFFIVLDDKDGSVLGSANTYQIFGSVTSGMETADAIYAAAGGVELPPNPVAMDRVTVATP